MSSYAPFAPLCSAPVALTHKIGLPSLRSAYRYLLILILLRFCILEPKILIWILESILIYILESILICILESILICILESILILELICILELILICILESIYNSTHSNTTVIDLLLFTHYHTALSYCNRF